MLEENLEPTKSIEDIKKDYSKLPMIYVKDKAEDLSQLVYVNRSAVLPPLSYMISDSYSNPLYSNKLKSKKALSNNINLNFQRDREKAINQRNNYWL